MAAIRKLLSPRGRGRRVPRRAEEPLRRGCVLEPPHFAGDSSSSPSPPPSSPSPTPSSPSPSPSSTLSSSSSTSPSPSVSSSSPPSLPSSSPSSTLSSSSPSSPSPSLSSSSSSQSLSSSSPPSSVLLPCSSPRPWTSSSSSSSAATEQHAAASWDAAAEEDLDGDSVMVLLAAASEDAELQQMDFAEKEEGLDHKGNAPLVEGVDQNFVKALQAEGVAQISIEKNLSAPINTVDEDAICDALMQLACNIDVPSSSTAVTSDGSNHGISLTGGDDDTMWQLAILAEEANKVPCIGDKEPLSALASDFPSDSFVVQEKIKGLCGKYVSFRRSCRDGNCFYRSFIFSYLEQVADMGDEEYEEEALRILQIFQNHKMAYQNLGKPGSLFENHYSDFVDLLMNIMEWRKTSASRCHEQLLLESWDDLNSNFGIGLFRLVTSIEICKRAEHFDPFLFDMKGRNLEQFCAEEVVRMGSEADHLQITALVDALGVPVSVLNIDASPTLSSSGTLEANRHDFFPRSSLPNQPPPSVSTGGNGTSTSNASARRRPHVTLLYRPGHYDILYPNSLITGRSRMFDRGDLLI